MIDVESFVRDLGLEELIGSELDGSDKGSGSSSAQVKQILEEVTKSTKEEIAKDLVEVIQLTRRVVYQALKEKYKNETDTRKAIAAFNEAFQSKLEDYLLEAEVTNIVNEAYIEFNSALNDNESAFPPLDHAVLGVFVDGVRGNVILDKDFLDNKKSSLSTDDAKDQLGNIGDSVILRLKDVRRDIEIHKKFCNDIFRHDPSVKADKILSAEAQDIKKNLLISFLKIILYPLKLLADFLVRRHTYRLHQFRSPEYHKIPSVAGFDIAGFMDNYYSFNSNSIEDRKPTLLKQVTINGKTQQYAVFDCFQGKEPTNGTIVFFHGNDCDINSPSLIDRYKSICNGYRIIMIEYPGFSSSGGPASKQNISHVIHKLFKGIKDLDLIKGDLTIMGESLGSYYAALLAKKIEEEEPRSCKGLLLSASFSSTSNVSTSGKIASYISDECLDTASILRTLPKTMPVKILRGGKDFFDRSHAEKNKEASPAYYVSFDEIPGEYHGLSDTAIKAGLADLRQDMIKNETLMHGKKAFFTEHVLKNQQRGDLNRS